MTGVPSQLSWVALWADVRVIGLVMALCAVGLPARQAAVPAPSTGCFGNYTVVYWQPYGPGRERTYRYYTGAPFPDPVSDHHEPAHPAAEHYMSQGAGLFVIRSTAGPTQSILLPACVATIAT